MTASTRRCVSAATGSRSFWKMLVTCFSTPRSVRKTASRSPSSKPFGHQLEHLPLARGQVVERIAAPSPADQLRHHARIERRAARATRFTAATKSARS